MATAAVSEYEADIMEAARAGDAEACFGLALLYEFGSENIARNLDKALIWYEKAGREFVPGACLYLGLKYENGSGVGQDYTKARCWYRCAAEQQWPAAQLYLAGLYENGRGGEQSDYLALAWLSLAADEDYPGAAEDFARLLKRTGFKDITQLEGYGKRLLHSKRTPCN